MSETVVDSVDILDRPRPSSRVIAFGKAVIGILWSSVRHPGQAITIDKATGHCQTIHG